MNSQADSRTEPPRTPPAPGRRATVAALIAVAVVTALLFWVAHAITAHNRLQNCIDSGRRDCVPVDAGAS